MLRNGATAADRPSLGIYEVGTFPRGELVVPGGFRRSEGACELQPGHFVVT